MEQARLFIAIVLSFIVFFAWNYFFTDPEELQKKTSDKQSESLLKTTDKTSSSGAEDNVQGNIHTDDSSVEFSAPPLHSQPERIIMIDSPLYSIKLSTRGAVLKSFTLKNYKETVKADSPFKEMIDQDIETGTVRLGLARNSIPGMENAVFATKLEADHVEVSEQTRKILFSWISPEGISVVKTFTFHPDTYMIDYDVTLKNGSQRTLEDDLTVSLMNRPPEKAGRYAFEGPLAMINNAIEEIKLKKIKEKELYSGKIDWIGFTDRYFMSSIIPGENDNTEAAMHLALKSDILETQYRQPTGALLPGAVQHYDFNLFVGPKSVDILKTLGHRLDRAVDFGWFDFIAKPCLWLMNRLYTVVPNYGLSIIFLTIIVKILFWPLGTKSYKSMNDMKKLQPLMTEIREKYKNDKQKMNEEVMGLYKTYKVNPVSGCLPMLAQMPIFFALYRMLYEAIELRHAPFFGWINDLSAPDRLLRFDLAIPLMEPPYGIPVLTIIMGATMFLQQKMSPPAGDPTQAKMMMLMPVVFTVIFINFSSGLVLYWLVNNVLSISQQYYIMKKNA